MKLLSYSGGSTKGVQLAIASIELYKSGFRPDVISGTSVGSLIALPLELGMYDEVIKETSTVDLQDMFKVSPVTTSGSISFMGWVRLLTFRNSLGIQDTRKYIKNYISECTFNNYKNNTSLADIYIFYTKPATKEWDFVQAKSLTYNDFIEYIEGAAHIPVMTEPVTINNIDTYDGGCWAHNPDWLMLTNEIVKPTIVRSIYSRDSIFEARESFNYKKNIFNNIENNTKTLTLALSFAGNEAAYWYCKANNIDYKALYVPNVLNTMYAEDDIQLIKALNQTREYVQEQMKLWI